MKSAIYEGKVTHNRFTPVKNRFCYSLFMMYLDLSELDQVFKSHWLWSTKRWALARFKREDHLGDPSVPLDQSVKELVLAKTGLQINGPIRLLTHLRYFGYLTNPVSFYYCFDEQDQFVEAIVAEVNNTPWGERHCYVMTFDNDEENSSMNHSNQKEFHVSPFMGMNQNYEWSLNIPQESLRASIENYEAGLKLFQADMVLKRKPVNGYELARVLTLYPIVTAKVTMGIYWQALKLWWKKCPFYPHPRLQKKSESFQP